MAYTYYKSHYGIVVKDNLTKDFLDSLRSFLYGRLSQREKDDATKEVYEVLGEDNTFDLEKLIDYLNENESDVFAGEFYEGNYYIGIYTGQKADWGAKVIEGFIATEEHKEKFKNLVALLPERIKNLCGKPQHTWEGMTS